VYRQWEDFLWLFSGAYLMSDCERAKRSANKKLETREIGGKGETGGGDI
jgi:hypothetical protein